MDFKDQTDRTKLLVSIAYIYAIILTMIFLYAITGGIDISSFKSLILLGVLYVLVTFYYFKVRVTEDKFIFFLIRNKIYVYFYAIVFISVLNLIIFQNEEINKILDVLYYSILYVIFMFIILNLGFLKMLIFLPNYESKIINKISSLYNKSLQNVNFYYLYEIFFCLILIFIYLLKVRWNVAFNDYFVSTILMLVNLAMHPAFSMDKKIKTTYSNIDYKDLYTHQIYIPNTLKENAAFRLVQIEVDSLYPEESTDRRFIIDNHPYVGTSSALEYKNKIRFYFCIPQNSSRNTIHFKLKYSYSINDKKSVYLTNFYMEIENYDSKSVPYVKDFIFNTRKLVLPCSKKMNIIKSETTFNLQKSYSYNYYFTEKVNKAEDIIKHKTIDNRKFLKHDGEYGVGKTVFDINSIINAGRKPVIISAWEERNNRDVLYHIFKKIKNETHTHMHKWQPYCWMFYFWILIAVYTLLIANYENVEKFVANSLFYNLIIDYLPRYGIFNHIEFSMIIIAIVVFMLLKIIIPYLIVFKNGYSTIYQDFFISEIIKMINLNPDIFLLVEDIDRLEKEEVDDIFRIISAINRSGQYRHEFMGLLSYSSKNLYDKKMGCMVTDLENKVCLGDIGISYDSYNSKKEFLKNIFEDKLERDVDMSDMKESIHKLNFRDVSEFVETCVIDTKYDDMETLIKQLQDFSLRKEQERINNAKLSQGL